MDKLQLLDLLARFWNIITLVFLTFMSNIQEWQYENSVCKQFCNPVLDLDQIIKSSAYKRELSLVPFDKTKGSDKVFSNEKSKLFKYRLKSNGVKK